VLRLISCSYYLPSTDPFIDSFDYKHERIDESELTEEAVTVRGFRRASASEDEEWKPYSFLAREKDCLTNTRDGTIRRLC